MLLCNYATATSITTATAITLIITPIISNSKDQFKAITIHVAA